ncbi:MAG TPA: biotin transporter BioY [Gemmatimonadales bacterium]|nr:biotin transporter BioY [Gemmatimonadales bacterium]
MTEAARDRPSLAAPAPRSSLRRRLLRIAVGAGVVAIAAQVAVPVPFTPVPMTLQPLAVLAVGGLLGAAGGAGALALYLALGLLGAPVFAGGSAGPVHLLGPTGGYLLAFPVAAALVGALLERWSGVLATLLACALGMVLIHAGGVAQLTVLSGNPAAAFRLGFVPFLTGDLIKVGLAAVLVLGLRPLARRVR